MQLGLAKSLLRVKNQRNKNACHNNVVDKPELLNEGIIETSRLESTIKNHIQ